MKRLLSSAAILGLLLCAAPATWSGEVEMRPMEMASFRKLFRRLTGELTNQAATNNIGECTPSVRRAIRRAMTEWGDFQFTCTNGVVRNAFVHPDSKINKAPEAFIESNLGLFDLVGSSISVVFKADSGTQYYQGKALDTSGIFRVAREGGSRTEEHGLQSISTRDIGRAPGVAEGSHIAYEFGIVDPEDDSLKRSPGIKEFK